MTEFVLRAERLRRHIGDQVIVRDASLDVAAGEWVSVVGPSGCGKTTLLTLLGLLDRPDGGRLWLGDQDTAGWSAAARARARLERIGFVFQTHNLLEHLTTRANVALPAWRARGSRASALAAADDLLARFDLARRATTLAGRLSTGEAQRVAIARALINRPAVVLADEPTGSLDSRNAGIVLDALAEVTADGAALVVATHDADVADRGRRIGMRDGALAVLPSAGG